MNRHAKYERMLTFPHDLLPDERAQLDRHLNDCCSCRFTANYYSQHEELLRPLAQIRPPATLRGAVLSAADEYPARFRGHRPRLFLVSVLTAALLGLGLQAAGPMASAAISHLPFVGTPRYKGQGYTSKALYMLTPQPVPPGTVSEQQAISVALRHAEVAPWGKLPPNVQVSARFGIYSDVTYDAGPAWIVIFSGPAINIENDDGGIPLPGEPPYVEPPADHSDVVVIDGKTGQFMEEIVS